MRKAIVLTCAVLALPVRGMADDDLKAREQVAIRRQTAAVQAQKLYGRWLDARKLYLEENTALSKQVSAWQADAYKFVDNWFKLFALVDVKDGLSYTEFEKRLRDQLKGQTDLLDGLRRRAASIGRRADSMEALLVNAEPVKEVPELKDYMPALNAFVAVTGDTEGAARKAYSAVPGRVAELENIDAVSRRIITARLQAALAARAVYPLQATMTKVKALLAAQQVVDPLLAKITAEEQALNKEALYLHPFHVRAGYAQARAACDKATKELAKITTPADYVQAAKTRADQLCKLADKHAQTMQNLGPDNKLVYQFVRLERAALNKLCKTAAEPPVACERLAIIAALKEEDFAGMSAAELEFVENQWVQLLAQARGQ